MIIFRNDQLFKILLSGAILSAIQKNVREKMSKSDTLERLRALASEVKHKQSRQQVPKKYAPTVGNDELIIICGLTFKKIKQDKKALVIQAVHHTNPASPLNADQACGYALLHNRQVSAGGWDWRPYRTKSNGRLLLKPIAPTEVKV
ncbi:hypothetical protein I6Y99_004405 [Vibrio parahaemolyticus]|nr:hypothetical protein [Vibrio parahaemolyticus]